MPESDRTVKCPICDEDFDPTVAGGWCTNTDCGEWQHTTDTETAAAPEFEAEPDLIAEGSDDDTAAQDRNQLADDAADETESISNTVDDNDTETDTPDAGLDDEAAGAEADGSDTTADEDSPADDAADSGTDDSTDATPDSASDRADEDHDNQTEPLPAEAAADDDAGTIRCPDCDTELDADANFCVECGADVQALPSDDTLDACPSCQTDVAEDDSFCVNCGEDLEAHRGAATSETTPNAAAANGTSAGGAGAGTAAETVTAQASEEAPVPERLVLSVEGRDITVEDGDRIGREIRAALLDAGRPEDEAVRIHREHVRFDRQPDGFYLVDLGDNPTRLNGAPLKKGDREPIAQGDDLELSGVVTMTIKAK